MPHDTHLANQRHTQQWNHNTHTQTSTGMQLAKGMSKDKIVLINCCGRGDKDMITVAKALGVNIDLSKEGQEQGRENKK